MGGLLPLRKDSAMHIILHPGIDALFFNLLSKLYSPFLSSAHLKDKFQYTIFLNDYPFPIGFISASIFIQIALIPSLQAQGVGELAVNEFARLTRLKRFGWSCKKENYPSLKLLSKLHGGISVNSVATKSKKTFEGFFYPDKPVAKTLSKQIDNVLTKTSEAYVSWYHSSYINRTYELEQLNRYLCGFINAIDAHQHLLTSEIIDSDVQFIGGLKPKMIAAGSTSNAIKHSIVFAIPDNSFNLEKANNEVFQYGRVHSNVIPAAVLYDGIKLGPLFQKKCQVFKEHVYGLKLLKDNSGHFCLASHKRIELYKRIADHHCILISHMGPNVVDRALDIANRVPNLTLIIAHLGSPMNHQKEWAQVIEDLHCFKEYVNIYFDISCIDDEKTIVDAVHILSEDRLIWGSDYPYKTSLFSTPQQSISFFYGVRELSVIQKYKIAFFNINNLLARAYENE